MRLTLAAFLLILFTLAATEGAIGPKETPVVNAGSSLRLTSDRPVTWSMAQGSKGMIDADGTYHAPPRVEAKQSLGGCQLLPANHVFNVRIDDLPVHPKSNLWMSVKDSAGRVATMGAPNYLPGTFPINVITSAAPQQKLVFAYTPANNGEFRIPSGPSLKVESGMYTPAFGGTDRHILSVERDTCVFQEIYNLYPAGTNVERRCPECTSQSGIRYSSNSYALPAGATDAAGMYISPLSLHRDEMLTGKIQHALRATVLQSFVRNTHIWPAMAEAGHNRGDALPFGARLRLKSSFSSPSKNPYTQELITQLKEYGMIIADIGAQWNLSLADLDLHFDPEMIAAFQEVAKTVPASNLEVVDESSLMENASSGETKEDAETVMATDKASGKVSIKRLIVSGTAAGTDTQYLVFQAGAEPHTVNAWINGSADKGIVWGMKPSVGNLSSAGVYTPPDTVPEVTTFAITARAHADPAVSTTITVTILPAGPIRIDSGNTAPYKDSDGKTWSASCCTPSAKIYNYGSYHWAKVPDIKLYQDVSADWQDIPFRIYVKPGNYSITAKIAEASVTSPGARSIHLESQGQLIYKNVDLFSIAGVRNPIDFNLPAAVGADGLLQFVVRKVKGEVAYLGALQISPDAGKPRLQMLPADAGTINLLEKKHFYATPWFLPKADLRWSLVPALGSVDENGIYTAPSTPVQQDTPVKVTARSSSNPDLSATSTITIKKGIPAIRINCGGAEFVDARGDNWSGDQRFEGGVTFRQDVTIAGASADLQPLYRTSRYAYGNGAFSYTFPLPSGAYRVKLKWAEYRPAEQVASQKIAYKMKVTINGKTILTGFDPIAAAGGVQKAYDQTFEASVSQSEMKIVFSGEPGAGYVGSAINGIEIEPVTAR